MVVGVSYKAAVVKGAAPLLVSRPALKRLGAQIDFHRDQLSLFQGQVHMPLQVNAAGQYMVDVMQFPHREAASLPSPSVDSSPDVQPASAWDVPKHVDNPHVSPNDRHSPDPIVESLSTSPAGTMSNSRKQGGISKKQVRKIKHQVNKGLKPVGKKYAVVELFCPPRLTPEVEKLGLKGLSLDKLQGWDLTDAKTQDWVVTELADHPPELLLVCPPCTDAGGWFHLNKCYMSMQEYLRRKLLFRKHMALCKKVIRNHLKTHGRLVFEHPAPSAVWKDPEMKAWCDELTSFITDMCRFNLHSPSNCKDSQATYQEVYTSFGKS